MAVSTISNTPPLFDRSNTFLDSFVPSNRDSRQPASKRRQLFPQLDSSEATPSENGSVYDAKHVCSEDEADEPPEKRPRSRRRSRSRSLSGQEWPPSGIANGPGVAVRFINRPDATPLTTIIEQKSIATLRSAESRTAAVNATRVNRWAEPTEQKQSRGGHAGRRQAALTIDEATLRELHEIIDSQRPPDQRVSSESGTGYVNDAEHPACPISPPQSPPVRAQTPCGLPRWPGDLPTPFAAPHRRVSRVRSFGYALRHFFRGPRGELGGRDPGNQTAMRGVHEVQPWRQWPHAGQADHRAGLAFWTPPSSGHGSSNPPGWHIFEPDVHEPTTEIDAPDSPAPETQSRLHARNGTRGQDSTQPGPRQLQDRQGPMQASMPGSAPPNVAQPVRGQASRRPLTPTGRRQERLPADDPGRTESPDSVYSTPTQTSRHSSHPLIPAPLFTSPPHSRRRLDPRIPVSPYDRLADVLSTRQPTSRDTPSRSHKARSRDDIGVRYTADDVPIHSPGGVRLRTLENKHADAHRIVSVASSTAASTCPTAAAASSVTQTSTPATQCSSFGGSSASTIVSTSPASPLILKPKSQPQTKRSSSDSALDSSPPSMGLTVIHSAALPILLPLAAAEGIVRPRLIARPVTPPTDAGMRSTLCTHRATRRSSSASADASTRALRGSSVEARSRYSGSSGESFHTATQTPQTSPACSSSALGSVALTPLSLDQVLAANAAPRAPVSCGTNMESTRKERGSGSSGSTNEEKGIGEQLGWLLRVCFCQPVGGVEDWESGGDNARRHRCVQRRVRQGSEVRRRQHRAA